MSYIFKVYFFLGIVVVIVDVVVVVVVVGVVVVVAAVNVVVVVVVVVVVFVVLKAYLMNKNGWRRECCKVDLVHVKKIFACQIQKIKNPRM